MNTKKIAFEIISLSGNAKATLEKALKLAHNKKFDEAEIQIKKATNELQNAHKLQTKELLTREANGESLKFNVLVSHAQDYLMTTYTMKDIVIELVNLYKYLLK